MQTPIMKYLKGFIGFVTELLKAVLYKWIIYLLNLLKWFVDILRRYFERKKLPRDLRKSSESRCIKISDPAYKRPDPMIYDQYYLMSQGIAVTWDNPDIAVLKNGIAVTNGVLDPATEYEIVARIWNNSFEAPIVGLPVNFGYLSFGVGITTHFIGTTKVNLGVKGGSNHPAFASLKWTTPEQPGHYCLQASFFWIDDLNPNNNLGQKNIAVAAMHSPAHFSFELFNNTDDTQQYFFEIDDYVIPPVEPCKMVENKIPVRVPRQMPGTVNIVNPIHSRKNYRLPEGWQVQLDPERPELPPKNKTTIHLEVTAPDGFSGAKQFNIHGFNRTGVCGGISVRVVN